MLDEPIDLAIIGAGPAGMAAALTARSAGLSVVVLDEQAAPGGQIYRSVTSATAGRFDVLGPDYAAGRELARDFEASGARHEYGAAVWQVTPEGRIHYLQAGQSRMIEPGKLILCTGAMERPFPIPGWTLPGVLTAGAAQILLKTGDVVPADPVVLAGCGPLLYLLAWQYLRAGVPIKAFIETTSAADYLRALAKLPAALVQWRLLAKGLSLKAALHRSGVPIFSGARELRIEGGKSAEAIEFRAGNRQHRVEARVFLLHQGVVPNTQITWSLRASHVWDQAQLCWTPQASVAGELIGLPGIFVAGDGAGIIGAEASMLSGRVAALAALRALQGRHALGARARVRQAHSLPRHLARVRSVASRDRSRNPAACAHRRACHLRRARHLRRGRSTRCNPCSQDHSLPPPAHPHRTDTPRPAGVDHSLRGLRHQDRCW